jgi:glyoxylase-like metal-dependent hydrolase (beta-lactamase superfamily II)
MFLSPSVSLLLNPKFPFCNSLLIEDEKTALVDTGLGSKELGMILKETKIDVLINSHTHPDHVAGNSLVSETTSAEIYVPEQEEGNTLSLDRMKGMLGVLGKYVESSWEKIVKDVMEFRESKREITYGEGHVFDFGKTRMEAVHTPGHSSGHFCFLLHGEEFFFSSDLGLDSFGPWYGYLNSSLEDYLYTIEKIKKTGFKRIISSHRGEIIHDLRKGLDRCLAIIEMRENKIVKLLREGGKRKGELARHGIVYRNLNNFNGPMREFLTFFEENMIREHLKLLASSGKIKGDIADFEKVMMRL